ncbi:MAG TPA: hypothetical protein VEZ72_21120 [Paenibacillus sp.]|nr:hypothetical protein [Paenibacillus sp.]
MRVSRNAARGAVGATNCHPSKRHSRRVHASYAGSPGATGAAQRARIVSTKPSSNASGSLP